MDTTNQETKAVNFFKGTRENMMIFAEASPLDAHTTRLIEVVKATEPSPQMTDFNDVNAVDACVKEMVNSGWILLKNGRQGNNNLENDLSKPWSVHNAASS